MPFTYQDKPAVQVVVRDITARKLTEKQLKASLKEKEVLLKEIHHRVKNNLQIISSLLDLSRRRTENQEVVDLLSAARAKVHTMALIHTQLYQSERFDRIDMQSHIRDMIIHLSQLYGAKENITPIINASDVHLSVTQAIPCALALNELISNVYRHAFQQGEEGTVEVSMEQSSDGTISLNVKDDGIGIPEEIDINETDTLGLKLVRNLVLGQLSGRLQIERNDGTEILIEFRVVEEEV
jgi:two-component sensor histidine kinase